MSSISSISTVKFQKLKIEIYDNVSKSHQWELSIKFVPLYVWINSLQCVFCNQGADSPFQLEDQKPFLYVLSNWGILSPIPQKPYLNVFSNWSPKEGPVISSSVNLNVQSQLKLYYPKMGQTENPKKANIICVIQKTPKLHINELFTRSHF